MSKLNLTATNYSDLSRVVAAGDRISLKPGTYKRPLAIRNAIGTRNDPIVICPSRKSDRGKVVFSSDLSEAEARNWANAVANQRQRAGYYPSFGQLGDQAMLVLRNCQHVVIHGLDFEDCWPTAIYLDKCQFVTIHDTHFRGGTIAIGANGIDTHDIVVQHCRWRQDKSGGDMWERIPWGRIHGAKSNMKSPDVDTKGDYRHYDGDFFRAWNVSGNVTIRNNTIEDAFNGIHFFNSFDKLAPGVAANQLQFNGGRQASANVLIERNRFVRIRDNVFEPEGHAWNWVIRHNHIQDCYRPFSFEFERAGWIYVYGNTGYFGEGPSQGLSDADKKKFKPEELRGTASLFKPKGEQANEGPIVVAFNSWYLKKGKGILPKFALGELLHVNNAIQFHKPKYDKARLFGQDGYAASSQPFDFDREIAAETLRFTRRWADYNIVMDGDVANDEFFPVIYRSLGYAIGAKAKNGSPDFLDPDGSVTGKVDFRSNEDTIVGTSIEFVLILPDGSAERIDKGVNVGAVQTDGFYENLAKLFQFLPDTGWLPDQPPSRMATVV